MTEFKNKKIYFKSSEFIYRVEHLTLEGTCSIDHGPKNVKTKNLYVDKYPVTNARYKEFLNAIGQNPQTNIVLDSTKKLHVPQFWYHQKWNDPEQPVVGVDWHDAQAYCCWSQKSLPTEAEWEKAARGTDCRHYPWGNELPDLTKCNYNCHVGQTSIVGEYGENSSPYGCYDMSGNVWEWCEDW